MLTHMQTVELSTWVMKGQFSHSACAGIQAYFKTLHMDTGCLRINGGYRLAIALFHKDNCIYIFTQHKAPVYMCIYIT